jgi:predicted amidohydrolase YtcJ
MKINACFFGLFCLLFSACKRDAPDLVIYGGPIYTANEKAPTVEAVAVTGNTITFAGAKSDVLKLVDKETKVIDLHGRTLTPGWIEGHGHLVEMALQNIRIDVSQAKSFDEIIEIIRLAAKDARPGEWIVGVGWHQDKWAAKPTKLVRGFPIHTELSQAVPDNPVFLRHASGHAGFVNAKAMELLGVNPLKRESTIPEIEGGEIFRDENGNPTGLFNENALTIIENKIEVSDTDLENALQDVMQTCLQNGITGFHDAGESQRYVSLLKSFRAEKKLPVRIYLMLSGSDTALVRSFLKTGIEIDSEHWLTIRAIKYYSDGALGSRGAWLLEPYTDSPATLGTVTLSMDSLYQLASDAFNSGFQVCTHAIGDRANHEVLNQYERIFSEHPEKASGRRFRIEHAQHLHPDDIGRFAKLGVLPAMQAIHMSSDRPWAIDRLGPERIRSGAYVWQSLLRSGAVLINGTDVPVEPLNPLACFYASVTRKTLKGEPEGGYESDQKMTREQALRSYTLSPAYGAFEETIKGSIEVGKLADFTVFNKDIMRIPEAEILKTEVVLTIVDGKIVFEKN